MVCRGFVVASCVLAFADGVYTGRIQRDQHAEVTLGLAENEALCQVVRHASFLHMALEPWDGTYKKEERCIDVAVLTNTATPSTCNLLKIMVLVSVFLIGLGLLWGFGAKSLVVPVAAFAVAWYYVISTGLSADYSSGAMSWEQSAKGLVPHNVSMECLSFSQEIYVWTAIFVVYSLVLTCLLGPMFIMTRMSADTEVTKRLIAEEDRQQIDSEEFRKKCVKAFRDADADGNGVLDMGELKQVALGTFELSDAEKNYVQESELFKEAFDKCDADNSRSIDQTEFLEVMKYITAKAKYGASQLQEEA